VQVDEHAHHFNELHPHVAHLDTITDSIHHHLPKVMKGGTEFTSELNTDALYDDNHPKEIYRISVNGEYEYYDGKAMNDNEQFRKTHPDGYKPISSMTFFYKAKDEGVIVEGVSAHDFLSMSKSEQQLLLHHAIMLMNQQETIDEARN